MASVSRARRADQPRSGGEIVRNRRISAAKTPYDRPRPPPPVPENPNWLSTATRVVVNGAGKLLSSVFGPDSSSSSSGSDSGSDDEVDDDNDHDDITSQGSGRLHQDGTSLKMIQYFRKEPQPIEWKNEAKHVIEQLLMQETFSREECDRLIEIIKSRVVDCPKTKDGLDGSPTEIPNRTIGSDAHMTDLCSTAVMEAKKWLEEKKLGSSSTSELDHGTCSLNSVVLPPVTNSEVGSPVDMAKSYMRARPLWASPSMKHIEFKTPSPMRIQPFKEEIAYSIGGISLSSSKMKRDSVSLGSWNIQEEIRRVRAKATEDLLGTLPSPKIDLTAFTLENKTSPHSLVADRIETGTGDEPRDPNSLIATESLNLAAGVASCHDIPVSEMTQDGLRNEVLLSTPAILASEQNQDLEASQKVEGKQGLREGLEDILSPGQEFKSRETMKTSLQSSDADDVYGLKDTNGSNQQRSTMEGIIQDSRSNEQNCATLKGATGLRDTSTANGFPSSGSSLPVGLDTEPNPGPSNEDLPDTIDSNHIELTRRAPMDKTCELLSEVSVEVPSINETDGVASGSQNSSSMHYEELLQIEAQTNSKHSNARESSSMVEKQKGKRLTRYNRKGRGRGK